MLLEIAVFLHSENYLQDIRVIEIGTLEGKERESVCVKKWMNVDSDFFN